MAKKDEKSHKNAPLIGIDIGGTGIKGGIVDLKKGKLLGERFRVPTPQPATPESVAEAVALVVSELSARPEAPAAGSPVGVTFPGIIQHGVVRDFTGHGVGEAFHTGLIIPHYDAAPAYNTVIETGMVFTIEPMLTLGTVEWDMWADDWTVVTKDRKRTAQFEHTLLVTDTGAEILTLP